MKRWVWILWKQKLKKGKNTDWESVSGNSPFLSLSLPGAHTVTFTGYIYLLKICILSHYLSCVLYFDQTPCLDACLFQWIPRGKTYPFVSSKKLVGMSMLSYCISPRKASEGSPKGIRNVLKHSLVPGILHWQTQTLVCFLDLRDR